MVVRRIRLRPKYASVTATLALFVALSGGAYAAGVLPANSVDSKQIKKNAVVRAKIKNNAVDGSKVLDGSLTGDDVKESSFAKVPSASLADSAASATHSGSSGALDKVSYRTATAAAPAGSGNGATAGCDAGQHVVGGGVRVDDPINAFIVDDYPDAGNTVWSGRVGNSGPAAVGFTVYAICTTVGTIG
jgi:hypothetical protein